MPAQVLMDELGRLHALRALEILDSPREQAFDDLTELAAQLCDVPIALISFVDEDRQWFKACYGIDVTETPRAVSFCAHALKAPAEPLVVTDARVDPRFAENPLVVGPPHVVFYAGAPLVTDEGYALGTLCVVDHQPRVLTAKQLDGLTRLARLVVVQLNARELAEELNREGQKLWEVTDTLLQSERRYRELVEHAQGLICIHTLDGTITMANSAVAETLGYPVEQIVGRNIRDFMPPRFSSDFQLYIDRLNKEQRVSGLLTLTCADGRRAALAYRNFRFEVRGEDPVVIGHAVEITERITAERMNRRVEAMLQETPDSFALVDPYGRPLLMNRAGRAMLGLQPDDPLPQFDVREPEGNDAVRPTGRPLGIAAQSGVWQGETTIVSADGRRTDVWQSILLNRNARGVPDFYAVISRDLTEQRRAEEAIRQGQRRLEAVVRSLKEVVFETDAAGLWTYLNPAWTEITGFAVSESLGVPFFEFLHPDDVDLNRERFEPLIQRKKEYCRHEIRYRTADGGFRWIEVHARLVLSDTNEILGTTGTLRDVTEQRALAAELVDAREEALTASRLKSEFLANMSHEIRTPINGVLGLTTLLLDTELSAEQRDFAEGVTQSAEALLGIINDVLDLSKIEAGRLDIELLPFDITRLLAQVHETVGVKARLKQLEFQIVRAPDLPAVVIGDAGRLRQVLLNLADNAVKFTNNGAVTVEAARHFEADGAERLRFTVRDSGMGIPPDKIRAVFEKFSQADSTTARRFGGTGLGLAICQQLVSLMGGSISVSSTLGQGSTFSFDVPLRPWSEAPRDQSSDAGATAARRPADVPKYVLLVEDNAINQKVATRFLAKEGCIVDVAEDGMVALKRVVENHYDAIFMDCQMPGMDGYETTKQIRVLQGYEQVPIIGVTAHAMVGDREKCLAAGMTDYLAKPLHPDDVHAALLRAVDARQPSVRSRGEDQMTMTMEFDADLVLSAFDGEVADVKELVALVAASIPAYVADLRAGFAAGDTKKMAAMAHTIRGAVGNVGAERLAGLTRELEDMVRGGVPVTNDAILAIERATSDMVTSLTAWADSLGHSGGPA